MPIVEMRTTYAGPDGVCDAGAEMKVDRETAKALIDGGFAVKPGGDDHKPQPVEVDDTVDAVVVKEPKTATRRKRTTTKSGPQ